jgi:cold-inducible RNA-binding protein
METSMNIYCGNLSYDAREEDVRNAFEAFGTVDAARIITDRDSGRSKGFGFVEMPEDEAARKAIEALNDTDLMGRNMNVNEARPKTDNRGSGGGGGGGGGGYGGGGRDRY